jgi:hypothetical protein
MNAERVHREDYGRACIAGVAVTEAVSAGADLVSSTQTKKNEEKQLLSANKGSGPGYWTKSTSYHR